MLVINFSGLHWYLIQSLCISIFTNWGHSISIIELCNLKGFRNKSASRHYCSIYAFRMIKYLRVSKMLSFPIHKLSITESHRGSFLLRFLDQRY